MPNASAFLLFMAASLALLVVPGPAVMYIVARSIDQGRMLTDSIYATVAGAVAGRLKTGDRLPRVRRIAASTTYIALSALALLLHPTKY